MMEIRGYHIKVGIVVLVVIGISLSLIPSQSELDYMAENALKKDKTQEEMTGEKQAQLEQQIETEGLNAQAVSDLADSYVAQGRTEKAIALMERYRAQYPTDIQMLDKLGVIYHVAGQDDKYIEVLEVENELMPSVNTSYILQARYSKLYGDTQPEKTIKVLRTLVKLQPENVQNYKNLIFFLFKADQGDEVIETIRRFKERHPDQMDYSFMFSLVDQLIKHKDYDYAYREAEAWVRREPEPALIDFATMFYNGGRADLALKLMEGRDTVVEKNPLLLLLKVKAAIKTDPGKALSVASNWMKAHTADFKMLEDFGNVLFSAERYQEVIALYTPHKKEVLEQPKLRDFYRESLMKSVKTHPENAILVAELYEKELNDPATPQSRRKDILFVLDDIGAYKTALPYLEKYAFQYRGDWVYMYEYVLEKHHETKRLAAFRHRYVRSVKLTNKEARYFLSIYMNEGNKPEAERLLLKLAAGKPAKNKDVQGLLYLWGIMPTPSQLNWIEKRTLEARSEDKLDWLKIFANLRAYDRITKIVQMTIPPEERSIPLLNLYFDALLYTKDKRMLNAEITSYLYQEQDEMRLLFFCKAAQDQGLLKEAAHGYEKLVFLDPSNVEYLKERGMIAYYLGDIETAKRYLNAYYARDGRDITALFYFAELLQQSNTLQARPLFEEAVRHWEAEPELPVQEHVMKIHSLVRLHRYEQASREMEQLLADHPDNPHLKMDYAEFLIDTREYEQSAQVIAAAETEAPAKAEPPLKSWKISGRHISSVRYTPMSNEVLLVYARPTIAYPHEIRELKGSYPDWISDVYPGYDVVLVTAKPGKQVAARFDKRKLIIEAREIVAPSVLSEKATLALRRELLRARIEQETHRTEQAIARLEKLMAKHPDNVAVISGLAIANRAYGRRLKAMDLAEKAHALEPENRWVNIMLADMRKADQPYARLDYEWLHLTGNDQFIAKLSGVQPVSRNVKMGAAVENNIYSFRNLEKSDGLIGRGSGTKQRGQIDVAYEFEDGPVATSTLYLNPGASLGFGEQLYTHDRLGPVNIYGEVRRSDWTFTQRIPDNVTRDRVGFVQSYSPEAEIYSFFAAAVTNYNQEHKSNVAQSMSFSGGIHAPVSLFDRYLEDVPVIVGYGVDAEYVTSRKYGTNIFGQRYRLYPLISREVHFIDATYRHAFDPSLVGELTGGYAYDRMTGNNGPAITGRLTKIWDEGWEAQVRATQGISFTQGGSGITTAGGYVVRKF